MMKLRHGLMLGAFCVALWLAVSGTKTDDAVVEPVTRPRPSASPSRDTVAGQVARKPVQTLQTNPTLVLRTPPTPITDSPPTANVFAVHSWTPPPPPPPPPPKPVPPPPPPPPQAPRLPFVYIGKKLESGIWEVYLSRGDAVVIARDQLVIDGIYRVDGITASALTLMYLPLNQTQSLPIGATEP